MNNPTENIDSFFHRDINEIISEVLIGLDDLPEIYNQLLFDKAGEDLVSDVFETWFTEVHKLRTLLDRNQNIINENTSKYVFWFVIVSYIESLLKYWDVKDGSFKPDFQYNITDFLKYLCLHTSEDYSRLQETFRYRLNQRNLYYTLTGSAMSLVARQGKNASNEMYEDLVNRGGGILCILSKGIMNMVTRFISLKRYAEEKGLTNEEVKQILLDNAGYISVPKQDNLETTIQPHIKAKLDRLKEQLESGDNVTEGIYIALDDQVSGQETISRMFSDLENHYPYDIIKLIEVVTDEGDVWIRTKNKLNVKLNN